MSICQDAFGSAHWICQTNVFVFGAILTWLCTVCSNSMHNMS